MKAEDIYDLYHWRNHPKISHSSFNTKPIPWKKHEKWFKEKSKDSNVAIYIAYYGTIKIGTIRFEAERDFIRTNVMLSPEWQGKGFGTRVIQLGVKKFIRQKRTTKPLIAQIKIDNLASKKAFQKAGFRESYITYILNKKN